MKWFLLLLLVLLFTGEMVKRLMVETQLLMS